MMQQAEGYFSCNFKEWMATCPYCKRLHRVSKLEVKTEFITQCPGCDKYFKIEDLVNAGQNIDRPY